MTVPMLQVQWVDEFDPGTSNDIVGLVNSTVGDGGTLGYAPALSDDEANALVTGLRHRVAGGDSHVLLGRVDGRAAFLEPLGQVYGLKPTDLEFFSVHQAEDVGHVEQGLNLVSALCDTPAMRREALEAVDHTCRLFYAMYDGMYDAFCRPAAGQPSTDTVLAS